MTKKAARKKGTGLGKRKSGSMTGTPTGGTAKQAPPAEPGKLPAQDTPQCQSPAEGFEKGMSSHGNFLIYITIT
jgi:hypothetical protein